MNLLFLCPRLPLPADTGGKIRSFNIIKQLSRVMKLHLLCFSFEESDKDYLGEFNQLGIDVTMIKMEKDSFWKKAVGVLIDPLPYSVAKYGTKRMSEAIEAILKVKTFDAVHVDHLHMAQYRHYFNHLPAFLDEHNVEYRILERCVDVEKKFWKKRLYQQQAAKMKTLEKSQLSQFNGVFACSTDDQQTLRALGGQHLPIHVIANGVDTEFFQPDDKGPQEDALVFTGSMDWLPNDDAITYFCQDILPLIWSKKNVKFYVVGKNPSPLVRELASRDSRVIVTGRVDDVRPYMQRSKVFIVPLRIGGGTRLKILEAMGLGKAIVSTTIGAEGIECTHAKNIFLGDRPQQFADHVLTLLGNPSLALEVGKQARQFVCSRYDWNTIGQRLKVIYEQILV